MRVSQAALFFLREILTRDFQYIHVLLRDEAEVHRLAEEEVDFAADRAAVLGHTQT